MKDLSGFAWRVLRALHGDINHKKMIARCGDVVTQIEYDVPHLQPHGFSKVGVAR